MTGAVSPTQGGFELPEPSHTDADAVARAFVVDPDVGLSEEQVILRREAAGTNELRRARKQSIWRRVGLLLTEPLTLLLLAAVAVSAVAWALEGAHGAPIDAIVILAIIILNAVLSLVQESRAEKAVEALSAMTRSRSTVLRGGAQVGLPSADLVPGDILLLAEGDQVGADGRLIRANGLQLAEASLTGESVAVDKQTGTLPGDAPLPLGERSNMVFKGTAVTRGTGRAIVTATGMSTEMGAIATMLEHAGTDTTPLQQEVNRLGRTLGRIVVAIAVVVVLTISLLQGISTPSEFVAVLLLGVSLAVAAVPEGLPAVLSVVLALGVQRMAKRNAVVKKLSSVETLGSASVICTDKTGTLTTNQMTIERIVTASGTAEVTGIGYEPIGRVTQGGADLRPGALAQEVSEVLLVGSLANDAQLAERDGAWQIVGDPTEAAFLVAARKLPAAVQRSEGYVRVGEVPFTSERKMMSVAVRAEDGALTICTKGAPDVLLGHCTRVQVGEGTVPLDDAGRAGILAEVDALSAAALRTLGVAYRRSARAEDSGSTGAVPFDDADEHDLVYVGMVGMIDPPRPEARPAIAEAHAAGIRVIMITGDHPATAARIAADLGVVTDGGAVSGASLDAMDEERLRDTVRRTSVFARVAPEHKLRIVDALQADGLIVAMTGDGVNDAPALTSADIGIAMGITGTEVTKEAADMILADDDFATIVHAVREGRVIFDNIRKFLRYLLYSNMGEVLTVFFGIVLAGVLGLTGAADGEIVLPLLATQILWINLVTDSGPALAMGVDPEIDDVMARRPRLLTDHAVDAGMWAGIVVTGLVIALVTLATMDVFLPAGLIPGGADDLDTARTAGFTTLVLAALITAFNARSTTASAARGLFSNPLLWGTILLAVALQIAVVYLPPLQTAFGTSPLRGDHWAVCVGMASVVLWVEEVRKAWVRGAHRRRARDVAAPAPHRTKAPIG
ncbi:cation-translocating P-type ATPase [Microbacterium caowuchunii]|nr:cation-translocating P-type ATPase [Microbacterium caowuchunii]